MTNISNVLLLSDGDFGQSLKKMKTKQDLATFDIRHLPFLIVPYLPFQKNETLEC